MITPRENILRFFSGRETQWLPSSLDVKRFLPEFISDNVARGLISQQKPFNGTLGGRDWFGVEWIYDPVSRGSMEVGHLLEDIEQWETDVVLPDLEAMDWAGCAEDNAGFLSTDKIISTTIYTGFFERLISFVGFEDALVALIDEEQQDCVHALFDRLADFYLDLAGYMKKYFGVGWVELHDDWGTQQSTMFSPETHREMIVPHVRKLVKGLHEMGLIYEQHSCGRIDAIIPNLISTGADTWKGQSVVDKRALVDEFGDRFRFAVEVRPAGPLSDEDAREFVKGVLEEYKGKNVWYAVGRSFTPEQMDMIEKLMHGS